MTLQNLQQAQAGPSGISYPIDLAMSENGSEISFQSLRSHRQAHAPGLLPFEKGKRRLPNQPGFDEVRIPN